MAADAELMRRALARGDTARRRSAPNPWVGAVVVRDGEVVGEGATQPPGGAHAEIEALRSAGERARGATLYTTLEPCSHQGRTPPCAVAIADAGVTRVVVALQDPDRQVAGRGVARLRDRGLTVELGVGADDAARALAPYLLQRRLGRAYTVVKTAMSLDGRIAARDGSSRWITGAASRADAHALRADSQAVVVGAGTALADRPSLTARDVDPPVAHQPLRVLLDATGRVMAEGPLFDAELAPTLVVTTEAAADGAREAWLAAGAKVLAVPPAADGTGVDLAATLEVLAELGVLQALVEGGAALSGSLVEAGLADRLVTYVAPTMLGRDGRPALDFAGPARIADAARWRLVDVARVGTDVRLDYEPPPAPAPAPGRNGAGGA
ncbi:MAG TPA: bifunctional diaminohydroxyphosphoribosylaminopyrimidine deaminase/5-amino-6-(5-phosphoribosylamino)uracil reductase RibD [Acidimicrobiia bacterium]|nr:bifunctional diaminohydroxyphosphoribosylaminopyrimidine deaminase/5-amino-6-(5-phosphoribosylamino)uracil reductase RibD [Acidimicrobiia bacterium]